MVLKKVLPNFKDPRGKWAPNYEGPYVVKQAFSGGALILTNAEGQDLAYPVNADANEQQKGKDSRLADGRSEKTYPKFKRFSIPRCMLKLRVKINKETKWYSEAKGPTTPDSRRSKSRLLPVPSRPKAVKVAETDSLDPYLHYPNVRLKNHHTPGVPESKTPPFGPKPSLD
ncbi:hypothetical protein CR513_15691, partial [Mucuna pruriens]